MALIEPKNIKLKDGRQAVIRCYQPEDVSRMHEFLKTVSRESTHTLKFEGMSLAPAEKLISMWEKMNEHETDLNIGAFVTDKQVGNLKFFQRNATHPWIRHIAAFAMAVTKDCWGTGLAADLVKTMEEHARSRGIKRIEAEVRKPNTRGIRFYEKMGFEIEGCRRQSSCINGEFQDEYYIAKLL